MSAVLSAYYIVPFRRTDSGAIVVLGYGVLFMDTGGEGSPFDGVRRQYLVVFLLCIPTDIYTDPSMVPSTGGFHLD